MRIEAITTSPVEVAHSTAKAFIHAVQVWRVGSPDAGRQRSNLFCELGGWLKEVSYNISQYDQSSNVWLALGTRSEYFMRPIPDSAILVKIQGGDELVRLAMSLLKTAILPRAGCVNTESTRR